MLSEIIRERINEKTGNREFEENSVLYEQFMIDLPKTVANFYRYKAHVKGLDDLVETLIAILIFVTS